MPVNTHRKEKQPTVYSFAGSYPLWVISNNFKYILALCSFKLKSELYKYTLKTIK